ncbi:sigma-54 dependent transcriptional regulator [bacterium]|nr:sigma-54 dependent transcriptional regulator [bacterium]
MNPTILIVDDEQHVLNSINRTLRHDYNIILSLDGKSALQVLREQEISAILADQRMPGLTGSEFFLEAIKIQPDTTRVLITGYSDIKAVIQAVNDGQIFYYIEKPWELDDLKLIMARAVERYQLIKKNKELLHELEVTNQQLSIENIVLKKDVEQKYNFSNIIGESKAMQDVYDLMKKVIPTNTTVYISGETGTGKELIARAIHFNGPRKDKIFAAQNCAALPDTLLESALFGHTKGAFTDATSDKKGLFEVADGGTVFLDELSDTSPALQQRLLRVIQEGEFQPVGSNKTIKVNVRILSAANRDLLRLVQQGKFREDLYYRINVFPIHIPPLRDRVDDIPLLANYFLNKYMIQAGKNINGFSDNALKYLLSIKYPGNVRELENMIQRAVILTGNEQILSLNLLQTGWTESQKPHIPLSDNSSDISEIPLPKRVEELEKKYILQSLESNRGNISKTAAELGLSRVGLYKKLKRYNLN